MLTKKIISILNLTLFLSLFIFCIYPHLTVQYAPFTFTYRISPQFSKFEKDRWFR